MINEDELFSVLDEEEDKEEETNIQTEEKVIQTYSERGRGKKQCPKCQVIIGVRNKICPCGHKFIKKEDLPKPIDPMRQPTLDFMQSLGYFGGNNIVYIPSGKCPVELKVEKEGDVIEWAKDVLDFCLGKDNVLALSGLVYWLSRIHSPYTKEFKKLKGELDEWYEGILQAE